MRIFKQWLESIYDGGSIHEKGLFELLRNIKSGDQNAIHQFNLKLNNMAKTYIDPDKIGRAAIFKNALNSAIQTGNGWDEVESELFWLLKKSENSI